MEARIVRLPFRLWFTGLTVYPFVFLAKGASERTKNHELVHIAQQELWWSRANILGLLAWYALYLLVLPVGWNPFRRRWETEAYKQTSRLTDEQIDALLKRSPYFLWW